MEKMTEDGDLTHVELAISMGTQVPRIKAICKARGWKARKSSCSTGEEHLLLLLSFLYPDQEILSEYRLEDNLRLDFLIPYLSLGFEFDGIQHHEYTPAFHSSPLDFKAAQERDDKKDELCREAGINLVRVSWDEHLTENLLRQKIAFLPELKKKFEKKTKSSPYQDEKKRADKKRREDYKKTDEHQAQLKKQRKYRREQYLKAKERKNENI